jgi:hypothetical protein
MFLNYLKNFFTQKIVKESLANVKHTYQSTIKTVGIIFDETYFYEREALVRELVQNGIEEQCVKILVFKDKIKKNETFDYPVFSNKDLSWTATFDKSEVKEFIAQNLTCYSIITIPKSPRYCWFPTNPKRRLK